MIIKLFLVFAKIGAFSIGGGYAMIPFIQREVIEKNAWLGFKEFSDILAISQMTPGPIAINTATFVGYKTAGVFGSIAATLGVAMPSFIMIIFIASLFSKFYEKKQVKNAFVWIRPVVVGLLAAATYSITASNVIDIKGILIFAAALLLLFIKKMDPILVIVISAIMGIFLYR